MSTTAFSSYDEPLGPRAGRYFGDGYRNVGQQLTGLRIARSNQPGAEHTATARLTYPADWSRKRDDELVPHVSSVDTLTLATALCDAVLTHTRDLSPAEAARTWVRHATVRAGTAPHEDLDHIPVEARIADVSEGDDAAEGDRADLETTFKFRVGPLTGALTLVHVPGSGTVEVPGQDHLDDLTRIFGPEPHHYLDGLREHVLSASDLVIDEGVTRITGRQRVALASDRVWSGAESAYRNSTSIIDAVVGAAQLSQILLYHLDGLDRTSSNTLWMRKLEVNVAGPDRSAAESFDGTAEVRRVSVIDRTGHRWRSADIAIKEFNGVTGSCLLAHQLPD
ncbi:AvrD family protein [Nocardia sp. alder85J]|uniref:AvrD family protein n=1 Tax=Nocardia sp. alder85J TaxID=2862949 RepID=UPI001CD5BFC4|nr:AvrD family protein [Nocardia sp. alder85J]MCX4097069.1 AvrD family protein [Nocardia sp. alder85J]